MFYQFILYVLHERTKKKNNFNVRAKQREYWVLLVQVHNIYDIALVNLKTCRQRNFVKKNTIKWIRMNENDN